MISIINYQKVGIFVALSFFLFSAGAFAQVQNDSKAQMRKDFEQSFQQMLKDPADVDITMRYAKLAVGLGNYEAAIPPLERILIFNPNLPKIKLELGVLYYRLDSMKMAATYFNDVASSKDASREMKASAREYLQKIKG